MDILAAVAAGVLAFRLLGYMNMYAFIVEQWLLTTLPLLVAGVTALLLTWEFQPVIVAIALTEVVCLVTVILELLKDYLMMRNLQGGRRR